MLTPTIKKILFFGAIAAAIALIAFGIYFFFFSKNPTTGTGSNLPSGNSQGRLPTDVRPAPGETETPSGQVQTEPRLFSVHDKPVVSAVSFIRNKVSFTRFVEQGSGHVYEYNFKTKAKVRISNTSIPQIAEALWSSDGNTLVFRYEESGVVHTAVGSLSTTTEESAFKKISFLPEGIRSISISADGSQVFYIVKGDSPAIGVLAKADGGSPKILFSSPLSQWNVDWADPGSVLISTPQSLFGGIAYRVRLSDGVQSQLTISDITFGGVQGGSSRQLIATVPSNGQVTQLGSKGEFSDLSDFSWPTKCAFAQFATSSMVCANMAQTDLLRFDEWQRGEIRTSDQLVATNFAAGYKMLLIPSDDLGDKTFDMTNISLTPTGEYLVFKNRVDQLLWGVRVPGGIQ